MVRHVTATGATGPLATSMLRTAVTVLSPAPQRGRGILAGTLPHDDKEIWMTVETETERAATERVYDRTLTVGARRLGAWGPGFLTKAEGLWTTPHGVYVVGERADGDTKVSFRIVDETEAVATLRARGRHWRADKIETAHAPENAEADGETELASAEDAEA